MMGRVSTFVALLIFSHLMLFSGQAMAASVQGKDVQVVGLFSGAAVVLIDGKRHLIKKGQTKNGVKLIKADNQQAVVVFDGQRKTLGLTREGTSGGGYAPAPEKPAVKLIRNNGHYWATGQINGRSVRMIVDTGASLISMGAREAKRLGIDYKKGKTGYSQTANGVIKNYQITLREVKIGGIVQRNVAASVSKADHPILLGMSFLNDVNMREEGNLLYLVPRF